MRLCTAFAGSRRIASGSLAEVALRTKEVLDRGEMAPVLIFDDLTSEQIEVDWRGTAAEVVGRLEKGHEGVGAESPALPAASEPSRGPGRPRLGVVAREVTLLPRHWEWLNGQPGGASVALRKLVEEARRANEGRDRMRRAQEAAYRFMSAMTGNLPGFEEAIRALFAQDRARLESLIQPWPEDLRSQIAKLTGSLDRTETDSGTG